MVLLALRERVAIVRHTRCHLQLLVPGVFACWTNPTRQNWKKLELSLPNRSLSRAPIVKDYNFRFCSTYSVRC